MIDPVDTWPPGFAEALGKAVCDLNLAFEDTDAGALAAISEPLAGALNRLREVAFPACPGCSQAAGAGLPVHHFPPLCASPVVP